MDLSSILTDIGEGLVSFIPSLGKGVWELFLNMFLTFTEADGVYTVTGFNVLGVLALASLVMGLAYKLIPMVANWISKKVKSSRRRKARA